jgi:hypothetical protein
MAGVSYRRASLRNAIEPHVAVIGGRLEPELFVQPVSVAGRQAPVANGLDVRMVDKGLDQAATNALPAMLGPDDDIGEIGEHRAVGDRPAETDLLAVDIGADALAKARRCISSLRPPPQ